ncbi:MAG: hypothetical protein WBA01_15405, partial [Phormidesmis sp.]
SASSRQAQLYLTAQPEDRVHNSNPTVFSQVPREFSGAFPGEPPEKPAREFRQEGPSKLLAWVTLDF